MASTVGETAAYEWLRERGISPHTITGWNLGVVLDPLPGHERFLGRVSIPYYDASKNFRTIRFRRIDGRKPKYDGVAGAPSHIFAVRYAYEPVVYVTEGEFDTMILKQLHLPSCGIPGANAWDHRWRWVFRHCDEVVLVPDHDGEERTTKQGGRPIYSGGLAFKHTLMQSLRQLPGVRTSVVMPPPDMDPTEWYLHDRRGMKKRLER